MYQDLSSRHDWPVKRDIVILPIRMKGSSKRTSGNSLSPLGAQNEDIGATSQTLLTEVKLRQRRRLGNPLTFNSPVPVYTLTLSEVLTSLRTQYNDRSWAWAWARTS